MSEGNVSSNLGQLIFYGIYIYIMVIFFMNTIPYYNNIKNQDLNELFIDQIVWMYTFGLYHTIIFFSSTFIFILICFIICCSPEIAFIFGLGLLMSQTLANMIAESIFVNSGKDLSSELNLLCFNNVNNVTLCNYYKNDFNPSYILNIVLLACNSISFLIYFIISIFGCINM